MDKKTVNSTAVATRIEDLLPEIGSCYYDSYGGAGVVIAADYDCDRYTILWKNGDVGYGDLQWTKGLTNRYAVNYWIRKAIDGFFEKGNGIKEDGVV